MIVSLLPSKVTVNGVVAEVMTCPPAYRPPVIGGRGVRTFRL